MVEVIELGYVDGMASAGMGSIVPIMMPIETAAVHLTQKKDQEENRLLLVLLILAVILIAYYWGG